MDNVNTFSDFNRICLKNQETPHLRAWYLLRHHNTRIYGGNGWLSHKEAISVLSVIYKQNRPREIIKSGEGMWWEVDGNGYRIFGIKTIAKRLHHKPGHRVEVPMEAFSSIKRFRAFCYATFFAYDSSPYRNERGKNISRAALKEIFGISIPTQINYERIASIKVREQFAYEAIPNFDCETEKTIPEDKAIERYKKKKSGLYVLVDVDNDGYLESVYQMPNNYFVDTVFYKPNENKRVKRVGGSDNRDGASRKSHEQIYFDHKKQVRKRLKNKDRHFGYVLDKETSSRHRKNIYQKVSKWSQ